MTETRTTSLDPMLSVSTPFSFIFALKHWENMFCSRCSIVILTNCSHRPCCSTIWIWVGPVGRGAAYQIPLKRAFNTLTCPIPSHPNQVQLHNTFWYSLAQFPRRLVKKKTDILRSRSHTHIKCPFFYESPKGSHPLRKVQFFWTLFKRPLTPPPFRLTIMWWIFLKEF